MKKIIALLLVSVLSITILVGCSGGGGDAGDVLKGTWEGQDSNGMDTTLVFDGKGGVRFTGPLSNKVPGTYVISENEVALTINDAFDTVRNYTFEIDGSKLTLTPPTDQYYVGFDLTKK